MTTTTSNAIQSRNIQVYFLAVPEDQSVCEDVIKHLKPIIRNSSIPVVVNSDFNIPSGADIEKYKQRLFEADIVLALISVDFINNDDIYNRNQKVIERYNNSQTVLIPILVRNCMWKATPFSRLPMVPKNLQPLNNKQFWNSQDDAVMNVVSDIYTSINELAQTQSEAVQPPSVVEAVNVPDLKTPIGTSIGQIEPSASVNESAQTQSEAVQPLSVAEAESASVLITPVGTSISQTEPSTSVNDLDQTQSEAVQLPVTMEMESAPDLKVALETSISQTELSTSANELAQTQGEAIQRTPVAEVKSIPDLKAAPRISTSQTTSQATESSPIAVDWREKYYRRVLVKRAGAILLDYIFAFLVAVIIVMIFPGISEDAVLYIFIILYYVIMPIMESSKWQGTIGKRILKIQITNSNGERISFLRAFWRNIVRSLVLYSYIFVIPLVIQYFRFNKTKKLFHDELSGTVLGERLVSSSVASAVGNAA